MTTASALLSGRYRLAERLAVGGMGEVWRATDTVLDRVVAVKVLRPEHAEDPDFRARFRAEARAAARLSHPGIASVYDFGEDPTGAWLVLELVDGEPLSDLLRRQPVLPVDRVLDLVAQTATALQAAHDGGVVHRDVKPGNLLVRPDGVVKVTDFGIASAAGATPLTRTGQLVGTALYLSPEQAAGRPVGPTSDLYSLGVVAYEALAGVRPFPGEHPVAVVLAHLNDPPPALPATVPPAVASLVASLLAKDPAERPATAADLAARATALRSSGVAPTQLLALTRPLTRALPLVARPPRPGAALGRPNRPVRAAAAAGPAAPGSSRRSQRYAVRAIAVLLALGAVALGLSNRGGQAGPAVTTPTSAPTAAAPASPVVTAADLVGRSPEAAAAVLRNSGLRARLVADGRGAAVGTVASVDPVGAVAAGSTVVLHVVPAPVVQPPERGGPGKGKGEDKGKDG